MIDAKYNSDLEFLDSKFEGDIIKKEIVDYIDATRLNKTYPRKLKILTDSTNANMVFAKNDLKAVVEANLKSLEQYNYIIDAIITDNPKETAFSILYKELSATNKYRFNVFSTREAAIEWLNFQ
jgi:cellulose synthase/poly-beta-1,6-N-acetylglucosamine synthase-like glycosyltransferase